MRSKTAAHDFDYPVNMLVDAGIINAEEETSAPSAPDLEATVEYVIAMLPGERVRDIMHMYYRDEMTFEAIGKEYGVTRERVLQIRNKGLRMLRSPERTEMLRKGIKQFFWDWAARIINRTIADEKARIKHELYLELAEKERKALERETQRIDIEAGCNGPIRIPIIELEFSVRTYNCLRRSGVTYLDELVKMDYYSLLKVRNLGTRSMTEIVDKLNALGIDTTHMKRPGV